MHPYVGRRVRRVLNGSGRSSCYWAGTEGVIVEWNGHHAIHFDNCEHTTADGKTKFYHMGGQVLSGIDNGTLILLGEIPKQETPTRCIYNDIPIGEVDPVTVKQLAGYDAPLHSLYAEVVKKLMKEAKYSITGVPTCNFFQLPVNIEVLYYPAEEVVRAVFRCPHCKDGENKVDDVPF